MDKKQADPIDVSVGGRVTLRRRSLGISQEKLGNSLGVTFQQVQKYEKGTNRISASRLQRIAAVLSVPVSFFFEDAPATAAGDQSTNDLIDFLSSSEGIALNKAFVGIKDNKLRRHVINLVNAMAGDEDDA